MHNSAIGDLSLIASLDPTSHPRRLPCLEVGRWAIRVGTRDGILLVLDPDSRAFRLVPLETLGRIATGREECVAGANRSTRAVPLHAAKLPSGGRFVGDLIVVTYFGDNLVEVYRWAKPATAGFPEPSFVREIRFAAGENLGISDATADADTWLVSATGYFCFARHCPEGRFHAPRLFFIEVRGTPRWPFPELRPANVNSLRLYVHPGTSGAYVINAGDLAGGYSSLQRIEMLPRALGPEIRLPQASGAAAAYPLSSSTFAVLQLSGEHVFLIDADHDRLLRILRFDGQRFVELPIDTQVVAERSTAAFQDLLPDPAAAERFFLIDAKGERLIHVSFRETDMTLSALATTTLATDAYRSAPAWGFWLR